LHLMSTLGVPATVAAELSREIDINDILLINNLQTDITSALVNSGLYDDNPEGAAADSATLTGLVLTDPSAFLGEADLKASVFNNLFINMGFDQADASVVSAHLIPEGIFNTDALTNSLFEALAAENNPVQAEIDAIKGAETFFMINTPGLDLPGAAGVAQAIALASSYGFQEVAGSVSTALLDSGLVTDNTLRTNLAQIIAAQAIVNPESFTGVDGFRQSLSQALMANVGTMDAATAASIAAGVPITNALQMDILQQAIINAGVTYGFI
jgi:hypothetical protein